MEDMAYQGRNRRPPSCTHDHQMTRWRTIGPYKDVLVAMTWFRSQRLFPRRVLPATAIGHGRHRTSAVQPCRRRACLHACGASRRTCHLCTASSYQSSTHWSLCSPVWVLVNCRVRPGRGRQYAHVRAARGHPRIYRPFFWPSLQGGGGGPQSASNLRVPLPFATDLPVRSRAGLSSHMRAGAPRSSAHSTIATLSGAAPVDAFAPASFHSPRLYPATMSPPTDVHTRCHPPSGLSTTAYPPSSCAAITAFACTCTRSAMVHLA